VNYARKYTLFNECAIILSSKVSQNKKELQLILLLSVPLRKSVCGCPENSLLYCKKRYQELLNNPPLPRVDDKGVGVNERELVFICVAYSGGKRVSSSGSSI
jgi:hypothetical protein